MSHASEGGHWYDRNGEMRYTVIGANGKERDTTLRDARKHGWVPSVSGIIKCAAAPGLERWKQQQVLLAALTLARLQDEPEDAYLDRIMEDSRAQAEQARNRGTAIHAAIQGHYEGEKSGEFQEHILGTVRAVDSWLDWQGWKAERSFAHSLGFGGKCDLSCNVGVLDFKTKEFDTFNGLKVWDEHAMQLAAYRHGLGLPKARCAIVYVSTTVPGLVKLIEIPEEELQRGWTCFYSLLHFWQAKNTYRSAFEALAA